MKCTHKIRRKFERDWAVKQEKWQLKNKKDHDASFQQSQWYHNSKIIYIDKCYF